jgi:hypothetical protein
VSGDLVRIRWETVTCHSADVPRRDVPATILGGLGYGVRVERFLDQITDRDLSYEAGDDGGTIVEIDEL